MKNSIGAKIFGLAIFLLCLTLVLSAFLLWQVHSLNSELDVMAKKTIPLTEALADVNEASFLRRVAFECQRRALVSSPRDEALFKRSSEDFEAQTKQVNVELERSRKLLEKRFDSEVDLEDLGRIGAMLEEIGRTYPLSTERAREIIRLVEAGKAGDAVEMQAALDDDLTNLLAVRMELRKISSERVEREGERAPARYRRIFALTLAATFSLVLLGLVVARLVTLRLTSPVRSLIAGVHTVEAGDLSVLLPVTETDEIGALTASFNRFIAELRGKAELQRTFGKYVDPRVLEQMVLKPAHPDQITGRTEMSMSFGDLVGFSQLSERLTPSALVRLLNRHFTLQAEAVQGERGVVDKFIGDAIMAFWGPPFTTAQAHAELACRSALAQVAAVRRLRDELPELTGLRRDTPVVDMRVGVSTGDVVLGNLGSEKTRSFTVMGDAVNLGSRLEGTNRVYGTWILVSETTAALAGPGFCFREVDVLTVKGKKEPARIFELVGLAGEVPADRQERLARFAEGLAAYRAQRWEEAESLFALCGDDAPSAVFLERTRLLRADPPRADWDGVWHLKEK